MYEVHKQFRNILGFHVLLGREGGRDEERDLVKYFFNLEAKSFCSVFSSQHGKKITPQKGKGNVMFCQRKNKSHHHPTKGKRKCDVLPKEKNKNHDHPTKGKREVGFCF